MMTDTQCMSRSTKSSSGASRTSGTAGTPRPRTRPVQAARRHLQVVRAQRRQPLARRQADLQQVSGGALAAEPQVQQQPALASTNAYKLNLTDEADLEGLPSMCRDMAAAAEGERTAGLDLRPLLPQLLRIHKVQRQTRAQEADLPGLQLHSLRRRIRQLRDMHPARRPQAQDRQAARLRDLRRLHGGGQDGRQRGERRQAAGRPARALAAPQPGRRSPEYTTTPARTATPRASCSPGTSATGRRNTRRPTSR